MQQRDGNDILEELLTHISLTYSPMKATMVLEFMMENFPCRKHHIENCPECSSRVTYNMKLIEKTFIEEVDDIAKKHFKEFVNK